MNAPNPYESPRPVEERRDVAASATSAPYVARYRDRDYPFFDREFRLYPDQLEVIGVTRGTQFHLNLSLATLETPRRTLWIWSRHRLWASALLGFGMLLLALAPKYPQGFDPFTTTGAVATLVGLIYCAFGWRRHEHFLLTGKSGAFVFDIVRAGPEAASFDAFVQAVRKAISPNEPSSDDRLVASYREHIPLATLREFDLYADRIRVRGAVGSVKSDIVVALDTLQPCADRLFPRTVHYRASIACLVLALAPIGIAFLNWPPFVPPLVGGTVALIAALGYFMSAGRVEFVQYKTESGLVVLDFGRAGPQSRMFDEFEQAVDRAVTAAHAKKAAAAQSKEKP